MVNLDMSGENLAEVQHNVETPNKVVVGTSIPRKIPGRVDINNSVSYTHLTLPTTPYV